MLASTKSGADSTGGFIRMPREVALRAFGGVIRAKKSKFLAIAARGESYGKSPRQFNDLRFVPRRGRPGGMLVQNDQTQLVRYSRGKSKGQVKERREVGGLVMYWLVPQVTIQGSDAVLPVLRGRAFAEGFLRKGPMSGVVARIPVHVIMEPRAALIGAARYGLAAV
jgi:hypothetical protein